MIVLGREVEDRITGFRGIAVAKLKHLDGTVQYGVKPRASARRRMLDIEYIAEGQLKIVGRGVVDSEFGMQALAKVKEG